MSGRIPADFIQDLITRVDIVDVIGKRIALKKKGNNHQGLCPFHQEKTPSFSVSAQKQFYHCFGCGAHGNAIDFIKQYERLDFIETVEQLAQSAGLEVPREKGGSANPQAQSERRTLIAAMEEATQAYEAQLQRHKSAQDYLAQRGLTDETIEKFRLGYAPAEWQFLIKGLRNHTPNQLEQAGLIIQKEQKAYDRFRNRIIFPTRNAQGAVIAFGARSIDPADQPKYLNSPETPLFQKSETLYGLYELGHHSIDYLIVVEGYMDVIMLAQHGLHCAVATQGTALTPQHINKLLRYTKKIILCFDGDNAGLQAAWRASSHLLPQMHKDMDARILLLPAGEDPDSFVQAHGKQAFEQAITEAQPLIDYLFRTLTEKHGLDHIHTRAALAREAMGIFAPLPSGMLKDMLLTQLSELTQISRQHLQATKTPSRRPAPQTEDESTVQPALGADDPRLMHALHLLLQYPELAQHPLHPLLHNISRGPIKAFRQLCDKLKDQPDINTQALYEKWRNHPQFKAWAELIVTPLDIDDSLLEAEYLATLNRIALHCCEAKINAMLQSTSSSDMDENTLKSFQKLLQEKRQLQASHFVD